MAFSFTILEDNHDGTNYYVYICIYVYRLVCIHIYIFSGDILIQIA